jgi:hypothetical protein
VAGDQQQNQRFQLLQCCHTETEGFIGSKPLSRRRDSLEYLTIHVNPVKCMQVLICCLYMMLCLSWSWSHLTAVVTSSTNCDVNGEDILILCVFLFKLVKLLNNHLVLKKKTVIFKFF